MKNFNRLTFFALFILLLACLGACSSTLFTIDFVVDGQIYKTIYVREGQSVEFPQLTNKEGCRFDDWYLEEEFVTAFNKDYLKDNKVTQSMTAYARWIVLETIGLKYQLLSDYTYEVIGYIGDGLDIVIPSEHDGKKVTSIGQDAFSGLSQIKTIIIPPTVSKISPSAFNRSIATIEFAKDSNLKDIGRYVFENYKGQKVVVPDGIKTIEPYAFYNATNLESVVLPASLTSIEPYAFYNCTKLMDITLPDSLKEIGEYAFSGCASLHYLEIPPHVVRIDKYAFSNVVGSVQFSVLTSIKELSDYAFASYKGNVIKIPSSLTTIHDNTFYNCTRLTAFEVAQDNKFFSAVDGVLYNKAGTELLQYPIDKEASTFVVPSAVTKIGGHAFSHSAVSIAFDQYTKITKIDNHAFYNYSGYSISLPSTVKTLGKASFANCSSLRDFVIPKSVEHIGEGAFSRSKGGITFAPDSQIVAIDAYAFENYQGSQVTIPPSVVSIDTYAFSHCDKLTSIIVPENVASINSYAFYNCANLTSIDLPQSLNNLGSYAFYNCISLTEINIPSNVYSIGTNAFTNVSATVSFAPDSVMASVGSGAFSHYKGEQITLPDSITTIQSSAFYSCSNLLNINLSTNLTYIGDRAFYNCTGITAIDIPASVSNIGSYTFSYVTGKVSFDDNTQIKTIGSGAFSNYRGAELVIPPSVEVIGMSAFANCTNLTGITIPSKVISIGDRAFGNITAVINFAKDAKIATIGAGAFADYQGVSLTIPASVTEIGERVFYGCINLFEIQVDSASVSFQASDGVLYNYDITTLVQYPIKKAGQEYIIPDTVSKLYAYSLAQNTLGSIAVPLSVESIGAYAFIDTSANLVFAPDSKLSTIARLVFFGYKGTQIDLPDSVQEIIAGAFAHCQNLTSISIDNSKYTSSDGVLYNKGSTHLLQYPVGKTDAILRVPSTVTHIAQTAFSGNGYLNKVNVPKSVQEIGDNAFYNCTNLSDISVQTQNAHYMTDGGILYNKDGGDLIHYPANKKDMVFVVPDGVKRILSYAFKGSNNLTSVVFGENSKLVSLQDHAFRGCNNLSRVEFAPSSTLSNIGSYAFYGCSNLTSINIPDSVQNIGQWSFEGCSSLQYEVYDDNLKYLDNWLIYVTDKAVTRIELKSSTIGIGAQAFKYVANLASITLPSSVKSIGSGAFEYCTALTEIIIYGTVPKLEKDAFKHANLTHIYVEKELVDDYKTADAFKSFAHIIFPFA